MKVAFVQGLPPERQEKVFEVWLRLQRSSTGDYSGESVAEAIIDSIAQQLAGFEGEDTSPQWYRRYRLNPRPQNRPRTSGAVRKVVRRAAREAPAAA